MIFNTLTYTSAAPNYRDCAQDLQFAIEAGDREFAPSIKLLLREGLYLAHYRCDLTDHAFQSTVADLKAAYKELLNMETQHPMARQMQLRYKKYSTDHFWDFVDDEKAIFQNHTQHENSAQIIASIGNINKRAYLIAKRVFDFVGSAVLLLILLPLLLIVALMIRLDSPGPVFFIQERMGARYRSRAGQIVWEVKPFRMFKFRTMRNDIDDSLHKQYIERWVNGQQEESDDPTANFKLNHDPRITRIGRFLRVTSVDELPQLINVLLGDMSLVGPRPVPTYEGALYDEDDMERLASLPGITGWWQVKGRGRTTFEQQVELDIEYIHKQSLWMDIKILFMTIPAVLSAHGAK